MELIGDLERTFASSIYPNRVLFGLVGLLLVIGLVVLAWRRRWDLAARRHPGRSVAVVVALVVVGGPIAWYLGSPLFISTTVDEPRPVAAASARPSPAVASAGAPGERSGAFKGADEFHFGRGTARLIETAPGSWTLRLEDFEVRNGPDLFVYLSPSPDGYATGAVEIGPLKADRGNQNYAIATGVDVTGVRSVVIWCRQFSVLFATAPIS